MLEPLTDLERGILEYLIEYLRANTFQPSIREIGRHFDIKSTKTVSEHLHSLAEKGWIERDPARSRGIRILGLHLDTGTISIPLYDTDAPALSSIPEPAEHLVLDQKLIGTTRALIVPMPDESLVDSGVEEGDLLLVVPTAPEDLDIDDLVVVITTGEFRARRWMDPTAKAESPALSAGEGQVDGEGGHLIDLVGRVTTIIRRVRSSAALITMPDDAKLDVHTPAT